MARSQIPLQQRNAGKLTWSLRPGAVIPASLLENPDAYLTKPSLLIKCSDLVTIGRVPTNGAGSPLILRRLNYRNWRHRFRDFFRPSRARSAMLRGLTLEAAGVPTPRAIGVAERRFLRCPIRAYLLTEEMPGAVSIDSFLRNHRPLPRQAEKNLASTLASLHEAGFSHRDLKPSNVLINDACQTALIDLDAVRPNVAERRALEDLLRLARGIMHIPLNRRILARFFVHYARARNLPAPNNFWRHLVDGLRS